MSEWIERLCGTLLTTCCIFFGVMLFVYLLFYKADETDPKAVKGIKRLYVYVGKAILRAGEFILALIAALFCITFIISCFFDIRAWWRTLDRETSLAFFYIALGVVSWYLFRWFNYLNETFAEAVDRFDDCQNPIKRALIWLLGWIARIVLMLSIFVTGLMILGSCCGFLRFCILELADAVR